MKKILFSGIAVLALAVSGCKKDDCGLRSSGNSTPQCIQDKTATFRANVDCAHGVSVKEYMFQGRRVYVFFAGTCGADMATDVWDADCNYLGFLDGFTGNTKINGIEFRPNAAFIRTIWSN